MLKLARFMLSNTQHFSAATDPPFGRRATRRMKENLVLSTSETAHLANYAFQHRHVILLPDRHHRSGAIRSYSDYFGVQNRPFLKLAIKLKSRLPASESNLIKLKNFSPTLSTDH